MTRVLLSAQPQQTALRKDAGLGSQTAAKRAKNETASASAGAKDESGAALLGDGGGGSPHSFVINVAFKYPEK